MFPWWWCGLKTCWRDSWDSEKSDRNLRHRFLFRNFFFVTTQWLIRWFYMVNTIVCMILNILKTDDNYYIERLILSRLNWGKWTKPLVFFYNQQRFENPISHLQAKKYFYHVWIISFVKYKHTRKRGIKQLRNIGR